MSIKKILCIVGARPNFMKIAPIIRAFEAGAPQIVVKLVHTGQHYDYAMNQAFFNQLEIPAPDVSLEVGSGSHAHQTAEIMKRFEPILDAEQPDGILVVGDVNSTIACALVAAKKGVKVIHVEAGLRSRDRTMPEEINRLVTDQLSDRLYVTEREAVTNLLAEGIQRENIVFVGNVMIDTLMRNLSKAIKARKTIENYSGNGAGSQSTSIWQRYGLLTLHRPSNVDNVKTLEPLLNVLADISKDISLVFSVHPRTRARLRELGFEWFLQLPTILSLEPQGYLEMLGLMKDAALVLTDSGGMQEETTVLGVPCLTLRENTERPITIQQGTNILVGLDPTAILNAVRSILERPSVDVRCPELWDGKASERIVSDLMSVDW
jgi:UDP-N-acetylglucosamine 2-epimerase (non-hydrolysing)